MKNTHQDEKPQEIHDWRPGTHVRPGPRDGIREQGKTDGCRDFIARWRRAILRSAPVPATLKRTLPQLSDYELAIYLAVKCRGGQLDDSGKELHWQ